MASGPGQRTIDPITGWTVWGQSAAVSELRDAARSGPAHAYVFTGPPQTGKRLAALDFARTLCCRDAVIAGAFCGACTVCRRIARGVFPDVTVVDLKTQGVRDGEKSRNLALNIATVREVTTAVSFRPTEAPWRVIVVDDVETMQETAQEAFLKTLEEPPSYAVVILITSNAELLLPTIRSRCVTVRFGLSRTQEIESALIAGGIEHDLAVRTAVSAMGSMGWAFDAANDPARIEERETMVSRATEFVLADAYGRIVRSVHLADEFSRNRNAVFAMLDSVQGVWRSALYLQQGVEQTSTLLLSGEARERLSTLPLGGLVRSLRAVDACIANLEANVRPRLALESMVLDWPQVVS